MKQRDIDLLSSYLDGQLKPSESARLEARLSSDASLRAVLDDLRAARGLLRQLPMRKAPRNFTLTPKMVGKNPPLPRAYPAFRFVSAIATFLLFFTMGLNFLAPQMASQSPAFGMGGGGAPEVFSAEEAPAVPEAATEAPAEEPSIQMVPLPTATVASADSAREPATPDEKQGMDSTAQDLPADPRSASQPVAPIWLIIFAAVALLSGLTMLLMRQSAASRWRR